MVSRQPKVSNRNDSRAMRSPAWLLRGVSSLPGELTLQDGVVAFTAHGIGSAWGWQLRKLQRAVGSSDFLERLEKDGAAVLFEESLADLRVRSPWYYFSGGLLVDIRQQTYRVSFGQPARTTGGNDELATAFAMRAVGKQWIRAFTSNGALDE